MRCSGSVDNGTRRQILVLFWLLEGSQGVSLIIKELLCYVTLYFYSIGCTIWVQEGFFIIAGQRSASLAECFSSRILCGFYVESIQGFTDLYHFIMVALV